MIAGECISIGASVGIAIFPDAGDSIEQIMINADKAMPFLNPAGKIAIPLPKVPSSSWRFPRLS